MKDPNHPRTDREAVRQMSQQPPDAEARPAEASPPEDSAPASADPTENLVSENPLAPSDVSLPESASLADNTAQPEVFGPDVPDAFDGFPPSAPIESGDDMLGTLDLQPWLPDAMDNTTDAATDPTTGAEPSSEPADSSPGGMPSFSDDGPSVDPFAASPPPFTGPLVEVSPGVFVYAGSSMPWSTDTAPESAFVGEGGMPMRLEVSWRESDKLLDAIIDRAVARMGRIAEDKIESKLNYEAHVRTAQLRAINGR
jgi:hypothetical protein